MKEERKKLSSMEAKELNLLMPLMGLEPIWFPVRF